MPLRLVQLRIYIGTIKTETPIFHQTAKHQLNHLKITRASQQGLPGRLVGYGKTGTIKALESIAGFKYAKGVLQEPYAKEISDLLELNSNQLRWVTGLLTGHCHLKGHLFK
jgi:hypothetical protein